MEPSLQLLQLESSHLANIKGPISNGFCTGGDAFIGGKTYV